MHFGNSGEGKRGGEGGNVIQHFITKVEAAAAGEDDFSCWLCAPNLSTLSHTVDISHVVIWLMMIDD